MSELYGSTEAADRKVIDAVGEVADRRGIPRAQALAWLAQKPEVSAPIIGVTKTRHLDDAMAALSVVLEKDEITRLERDYVPHAVAGAL